MQNENPFTHFYLNFHIWPHNTQCYLHKMYSTYGYKTFLFVRITGLHVRGIFEQVSDLFLKQWWTIAGCMNIFTITLLLPADKYGCNKCESLCGEKQEMYALPETASMSAVLVLIILRNLNKYAWALGYSRLTRWVRVGCLTGQSLYWTQIGYQM